MAAADHWSPDQYARFRAQRKQPFTDLVGLVERRPAMRVVDLGCGTGELTIELSEALSARETLGVDSSPRMLERSDPHPGVEFLQTTIESFASDEPFDLVFSNAALHWVGDHPAAFARLRDLVAPGGQLAVQVPANHDHPGHRLADEVAASPGFAEPLGGYQRGAAVLSPAQYAELLHGLGFDPLLVRLQVYGHELPARDDVVEWLKGSLLTAYQRRLRPAQFERFLSAYRARIADALPDRQPFFYTYNRILMWGIRRPDSA